MDVSPHALDVPDIDSYIGLMHTLFTLEDLYGLTVSESDEDICLKVDTSKDKDAHELWKMHRGQSLVVWAIREGREAAKAVDESLMGYSYL